MKKVAIMIDSEFGITETEARELGFNFVPVIIIFDGKEMKSNVDLTLDFIYKNLTPKTDYKTAAPKYGDIENEYREALKTHEHVLYIPISKHLSSTYNTAKLIADEDEFKGKVTVYESEFIGPWIMYYKERLLNMMAADAPLQDYIDILSLQNDGVMKAWLFPKNLDRVYASGRLSKAQYLAGSLLKITPVMPVIQGAINNGGVIKTRSIAKAINTVVENTIAYKDELESQGKEAEMLIACLDMPERNEFLSMMKDAFKEKGYKNIKETWLPPAITGHVGIGGVGAGCVIKVNSEYKK